MEESTTTTESTQQDGAGSAQPVQGSEQVAATQPQEPTASTAEQSAGPSQEDNLAWLQKKGVDLSTPEGQARAIKSWQEAEKLMHQSTAKASELQKALGTEQPIQNNPMDVPEELMQHPVIGKLVDEINALKQGQSSMGVVTKVNDYFAEHPEAKELETQMTEIVNSRPEIGELVRSGYLSMEDLHAMAQGSGSAVEQARSQGGKEALQQLADTQQAKAIRGNATATTFSATVTRENFDSWYAGLSPAERSKPETQEVVNSLLS